MMSELQLYLLAIGVAVIFLVLGFNRWQEYKYRRQAAQHFPSGHNDVLLAANASAERLEPVFHEPPPGQDRARLDEPALEDEVSLTLDPAVENDLDDEPAVARANVQAQPEQAVLAEESLREQPRAGTSAAVSHDAALAPDPATEFVVTLSAGDPITTHALMLVLQQLEAVGKPVRWLGQHNHQLAWEDIGHSAPSDEFVKLAACLQLADRNGPLQLEEINAFCDMAQVVAANLYAVVDCPDKQESLAAASELDQFCADVDVLIGVNIITRDGAPFSGTKLRGLAESAGMRLMPDGCFQYLNDQGAVLFTLANLEPVPFAADTMKHLSTHGVTFVFDVPKAVGGVQAFNQMLLAAKQFTGPLSALMVDDNRKELSDSGLDKIRQQLIAIYATMERRHIVPGGAQAMRLFA